MTGGRGPFLEAWNEDSLDSDNINDDEDDGDDDDEDDDDGGHD